jgi:outer membrane lipoprotein-sorting protein
MGPTFRAPRRFTAAAALLALLSAGGEARAQAGSLDVHGMLPAAAETGYRGRKVVIDFTRLTPQVTTLTVLRQPGGRERRESSSTQGVIVVDGSARWQYFPEERLVLRQPVRGDEGGEVLRPAQVREALASYEIRGIPGETIAGRRSRLLEFLPRQPGSRPVRRVWIDVETGLVLRSAIYAQDNRLSWLSVFEVLEYRPPLEPRDFVMRVPRGVRVVDAGNDPCLAEEEASRLSGLPLSLPAYLPAGFARTCIRVRRQHEYGELQALYSDGLSLLSFFESTRFREPGSGAESAALVAVGPWPGRWYDLGLVTGIAWRPPWAHLALIGELSRGELLKVAASVRPPRELSRRPDHQ